VRRLCYPRVKPYRNKGLSLAGSVSGRLRFGRVRTSRGARRGGWDADVVVVGGGHNGLVCAGYLAGAGLDVVVVEARPSFGGCASSEDFEGATVNVCNCDHTMIRASGVIEDLQLGSYGLRYLELEPARRHVVVGEAASPASIGAWWLMRDAEQTLEGLGRTHPRQVGGYRRYLADVGPAARLLLDLGRRPPGPGSALAAVAGRKGRGALTLAALARLSLVDAAKSWWDDDELVAPLAATGPTVWGSSARDKGTGLAVLGYALAHVVGPGRPLGGSGALVRALVESARGRGVGLLSGDPVERLAVSAGRVAGVVTCSGRVISAPVVVGAVDPRQVLESWLEGPLRASRSLRRIWRARQTFGYESKLDAVVGLPPLYLAEQKAGLDGAGSSSTVVLTPNLCGLEGAWRSCARGEMAPLLPMLANVTDLEDPSVVPIGGGHTFSLEVLCTPYHLRGGWEPQAAASAWLKAFSRHVSPGFSESVRALRVVTPVVYEQCFGLRRGWAPSFQGSTLAAVVGHPRELARYRSVVPGLYFGGAGTYPGAGIWGACGKNAAWAVLEDLKVGMRVERLGSQRRTRPRSGALVATGRR